MTLYLKANGHLEIDVLIAWREDLYNDARGAYPQLSQSNLMECTVALCTFAVTDGLFIAYYD